MGFNSFPIRPPSDFVSTNRPSGKTPNSGGMAPQGAGNRGESAGSGGHLGALSTRTTQSPTVPPQQATTLQGLSRLEILAVLATEPGSPNTIETPRPAMKFAGPGGRDILGSSQPTSALSDTTESPALHTALGGGNREHETQSVQKHLRPLRALLPKGELPPWQSGAKKRDVSGPKSIQRNKADSKAVKRLDNPVNQEFLREYQRQHPNQSNVHFDVSRCLKYWEDNVVTATNGVRVVTVADLEKIDDLSERARLVNEVPGGLGNSMDKVVEGGIGIETPKNVRKKYPISANKYPTKHGSDRAVELMEKEKPQVRGWGKNDQSLYRRTHLCLNAELNLGANQLRTLAVARQHQLLVHAWTLAGCSGSPPCAAFDRVEAFLDPQRYERTSQGGVWVEEALARKPKPSISTMETRS
jgi:hypothetical protein